MSAPNPQCSCPRCGYDFTGTRSTWTDSCPLHGTCSECGLEFDWSEVLNPIHQTPTWFLEHPYRRVWRTFLPTYLRTLIPFRFWKSVKMSIPVLPWRLVQFTAEVLVTFHLLLAYLNIAQLDGPLWPLRLFDQTDQEWVLQVGRVFLWPYAHWDGIVSPGLSAWPVESLLDAGWIIIGLCAVLTPMQFFILRRSMQAAKVRPVHLARAAVYSLSPLPPLFALNMYIMYGAAWGWRFGGGAGFVERLAYRTSTALTTIAPVSIWFLVFTGVWFVTFWYAATKRYLRLKHSLGVAVAMVTIGALLAVLLTMILDYHGFLNFIQFSQYPYW